MSFSDECILLPSYVYNMHQDTKSARLIAVCKRIPLYSFTSERSLPVWSDEECHWGFFKLIWRCQDISMWQWNEYTRKVLNQRWPNLAAMDSWWRHFPFFKAIFSPKQSLFHLFIIFFCFISKEFCKISGEGYFYFPPVEEIKSEYRLVIATLISAGRYWETITRCFI